MRARVLKRPWQFRAVYRGGEKISGKRMVLFYYRTGEPGAGPFFGIVASKRVGGAVQRNRAKRVLREALARNAAADIDDDVWVVLVARAAILESSFGEVVDELRDLFTRAGLN